MKSKQVVYVVGGVALAAGALWLLAKLSAPQVTRGVTATTKGPKGDALTTTPIKTSDVAVVAPRSTLSLIASDAAARFRSALGFTLPARTDVRQPYGNPLSAAAAAESPKATAVSNYRPSGYAIIK